MTIRLLQISALLCCLTGSVLLIVSIISRHWLVADGYQQGLWEECFWGDQFDIICRSHSTETSMRDVIMSVNVINLYNVSLVNITS